MFIVHNSRIIGDIHAPNARKSIFDKNKWVLFVLTTGLMIFFTLWLIFVHVNQEGLFYPYDTTIKQIPNHWLHRAVSFNTYDIKTVNYSRHFYINKTKPLKVVIPKLICYYNFPSKTSKFGNLDVSKIDANLCTHINIAFASIVNNSIYLNDDDLKTAKEVIDLKQNNTNLKVLISVGGYGNGNGYPEMVINHNNRKEFIQSILHYVKDYSFDGVDLDWEFPVYNASGDPHQRMHFTQLLGEIRREIDRQEHHKFLLSVAVAAPVFIIDNSYDVSYINQYVDFINIMTYDYHFYTKYTPFTGINSPLYSKDSDISYFATLNINYTAHYWVYKGMDRQKMMIGLPTYGHTFRLINSANYGINAPVNGYGSLGFNGFVGYNEVCTFLTKNHIKPIFDLPTKSPYATRNHEWISFDDTESLSYKTEFIKNNNFGGVMVYALNTDDSEGVCDKEEKIPFPLVKRIRDVLSGSTN